MKSSVLLLSSLLVCTSSLYAQSWALNQESDNVQRLLSICLSDSANLWISGHIGLSTDADSYILHSSDGGETWEEQESSINQILYDIHFMDGDTGWVLSSEHVQKTIDGGETWVDSNVDTFPESPQLISMSFVNEHGYAIGDGGAMIKTEDYGNNWDSLEFSESPEFAFYLTIDFLTEDIGCVGGGLGTDHHLMLTTDGGETWTLPTFDPSVNDQGRINDLAVVNDSVIYAVGNFGKVLRSDNAGSNWYDVSTVSYAGTNQELHSAYFMNPDTGWVVGKPLIGGTSFARTFVTLDGGETWNLQFNYSSSTNQIFNDIVFDENNKGWICGSQWGGQATNGGIIFESSGLIHTSIYEIEKDKLIEFDVYPNPTTDFISIEYPLSSNLDLRIYNLEGKQLFYRSNVATQEKINVANLNKGVYIVELIFDNATKRYSKLIKE